jgi:drug/metabolite transporter (DMT)-like permease
VSRRDTVLLVLLGAGWGAVYPLTTIALRELTPAAVVVVRTGLSTLALLPFALRTDLLRHVRARLPAVLVAAALQAAIPLMLLTTGQQHVSSGLAGILIGSQPVWVTVLTAVVERAVRPRASLGVLLGLAGIALLFARDLHGRTTAWAGAALLAAAMFYAAGSVYIRHAIPDVPPLATAAVAMTASTVALLPLAVSDLPRRLSLSSAGWLVLLSVVATGWALVLFYTLIQRIGAIRANLTGYLAPAFALAYGVLFLDERITPAAVAGLVLILAGSYIAAQSSTTARDGDTAERQPYA